MSDNNQDNNNGTQAPNQDHHLNMWNAPPPSPPNPYDLDRRISVLEVLTQKMSKELEKINGNISKLVWIVLTAVILAIIQTLLLK